MKKLSLMVVFALFAITVNAQDVKFPGLDSSPVDLAYFPANATQTAKKGAESPALIKVTYARPAKKGREIFGTLEKFGTVYRLGANESTEIKFFKPVVIGGKSIPAGSYGLFAIPNKDNWTIIINKDTDHWGAYTYDESKDLVRVDVPVKPLQNVVENLAMTFTGTATDAVLNIGWDTTSVALPIQIK
jgi:hypothetical protein